MTENKFTWMIGGPQGSGINSVAETFAKALTRAGLQVFANIEYHSNIKGEHSYYRLRVEEQPTHSHLNLVTLLVSLDKETIFGDLHKEFPTHEGHKHEVAPGGGIIFDAALKLTAQSLGRDDIKLFPIPYMDVLVNALRPFGKEKELSKYQVMVNTIGLGATAGLADFDFERIAAALREGFTGRKAHLGELNVGVARAGYEYAKSNFDGQIGHRLKAIANSEKHLFIRGIQAVGIAKINAGCGLQTYYPITPATDESEYLESRQKNYNMVIVQAEDEIAAINMATGATHAGLRASTSTSGPGFSLMVEGLGWAGITEAAGPVIIYYQRSGPATGLPTRTEQGDLRFVLHAAHSEFPRIVIAPGDVVETYYDTFDAFNYADKYQMPVIVLVDKMLASTYRTIPMKMFDGNGMKVDRGQLLTDEQVAAMNDYKRYANSQVGVSARSIPGQKGGIFWATGDEHDEKGHITEGVQMRVMMMQKRMRKLAWASEAIPESKKAILHGKPGAATTIVGWGSTKGAILDGMTELNAEGHDLNFLQVRYMSPFPVETVRKTLSAVKRLVIVEGNFSAQLSGLIREKTGVHIENKIVKYDGRPFSQNQVYEGVLEVLKNGTQEVVVADPTA